jgi:hypothetical protein
VVVRRPRCRRAARAASPRELYQRRHTSHSGDSSATRSRRRQSRAVLILIHDATHGGGNPNKFIDADKKIAELINQLFPGGAGTHAAALGTTVVQ